MLAPNKKNQSGTVEQFKIQNGTDPKQEIKQINRKGRLAETISTARTYLTRTTPDNNISNQA
jgi:hypothetical protein